MKVYEYIKLLSKDDMALFLTYFCTSFSIYGVAMKNWKAGLLYNMHYTNMNKPILTYAFLNQEYDGKEVYQNILDMSISELSGMFSFLSVSFHARMELMRNGNPVHIIGKQVIERTSKNMLRWLESEIEV